MKESTNIRNLDTLEKEIYSLRLKARTIEDKLEDNFDHLQHNFSSLLVNSICKKSSQTYNHTQGSFFNFKNEKLNSFLNKFTTHFTDRAEKGLDDLFQRFFSKEK